MKLIRFILTTLVIALVSYCVYSLLQLNKDYKNVVQNENNNINKSENDIEKSVDKVEIIIPKTDDEVEKEESIEDYIKKVDKTYNSNLNAFVTKSENEEIGQELFGGYTISENEDATKHDKTEVLIQVAGSMVSISPSNKDYYSEQYHFENNNLILYVKVINDDEQIKYYFKSGELVYTSNESGDTILNIDEDIILNRSKNIYNRYIK